MRHRVVLVGSFDTKGAENAFVRDAIVDAGVEVVTVDTSVLGEPGFVADISREEVAAAAGVQHAKLASDKDRGHALAAMAEGARAVVAELFRSGEIQGAIALGGTGGTSLAASAFRELPVGVPKIIVSTAASGNTAPYVGETDLVLMPTIVDVAGLNRITIPILANGAAALVGMVKQKTQFPPTTKPLIAATMFGVTTRCVSHAMDLLEKAGYEVIVFHMTGSGGRALENLIQQGYFAGVLDVTTTELADNLVGGVFDAGPDRVSAAGQRGVPQVVSVGALDMVNFGARDSVPQRFGHRTFYEHNSSVTLMRTSAEESAALGKILGQKLVAAKGPTSLFLPLNGVSAIDSEGEAFSDPEANAQLFASLRQELSGSNVELIEMGNNINDPEFAAAMVERLDSMIRQNTNRLTTTDQR
jgi:uncharacterized protein (UPF0261 family)